MSEGSDSATSEVGLLLTCLGVRCSWPHDGLREAKMGNICEHNLNNVSALDGSADSVSYVSVEFLWLLNEQKIEV